MGTLFLCRLTPVYSVLEESKGTAGVIEGGRGFIGGFL